MNNTTLLHTLAQQAKHVIFTFDVDTRQFLYLNPFFEQVWQQKRETIMDHPATLLATIHPDDQDFVIKSYEDLLHGDQEKDVEFRFQLPDESIRWLRLTAFFVEEQSGQSIIAGIAEDISEWKENHEVLKKYAAKKNSVMAILSHDLARPLTNIQGLSTIVRGRLKAYEYKELDKLMEKITHVCKQGICLIDEFIQTEFMESTQVDLKRKRVEIVRKMKEVVEEYQNSQQEIHKSFHFHSNRDTINMEIDDVKFVQVINNLISNAIKFTPDGGEITLGIEEQEEHVLFTVKDNGIGIPGDLQEGLFEKFPEARRPGLKGEPSHGLGMSIIQTIVEWHNGHIWFESQENKGSTFYIQLPKE